MAKDYAIVPEEEVLKLKKDVEQIKRNPFQAYASEDLIESINNLTKAINALLELFKTAAEEMKLEEKEAETIGKKIDPLFSKIDLLVDQNQKIAKGIVAIADMLEKQPAKENQITLPPPSQPRAPFTPPTPVAPVAPPRMPGATQAGAKPPISTLAVPPGMPAPPPPAKKKGLFG